MAVGWATKSVQKGKTFQVKRVIFQTPKLPLQPSKIASLSSKLCSSSLPAFMAAVHSRHHKLTLSFTAERLVFSTKQIPTTVINEVGRRKSKHDCNKASRRENKCFRRADSLHLVWVVKTRVGSGRGQAVVSEVAGAGWWRVGRRQQNSLLMKKSASFLPSVWTLRAKCSHRLLDFSSSSGKWKIYNKGRCQSWGHRRGQKARTVWGGYFWVIFRIFADFISRCPFLLKKLKQQQQKRS